MSTKNTAVLTVTPDGKFLWHEDADKMIESGDFTASPAMPHVLRALRKTSEAPPRKPWIGLTDDDEIDWEEGDSFRDLVKAIEAKLKEKNT